MIKSLSTYNLIVPFVSPLTGATCSEYTLSIYIWDGVKTSPPASADYEITKTNFTTSTGNDRLNIARLVNDFIQFNPDISATIDTLDSDNQVWCKTEIVYVTTNPTDDDVVQEELTQLVLKGYSSGIEGENPQPPADGILLDGNLFRVSRSSVFTLPLLLDSAISGTVESFPNTEIDYPFSLSTPTESGEMVKVINIPAPATDEYINITIGARVITLIVKEEYKYSPVDVYFINKEGAQQTLTFFKERRDSLNVTKETYESIAGQPADGYHQYVDFNVAGKSSFTLTSGYVPEAQNSAFKQLMMSSSVYITSDLIPVNVVKQSLEYKTRLNERLISYEIDFSYSYSEVNTI